MIYLHVNYHLKVSSELEIYELDNLDKPKIEETCNLRQPVLFTMSNESLTNVFSHKNIMNDFAIFDVKIRKWEENNDECPHIPLKISLVDKLFSKQTSGYYSEKNQEFLEESGLIKHIRQNDDVFKPYLKMSQYYDVLFGTTNSYTPLKYSLHNRNYFYVCDGSIKVKLIPPDFSKYLNLESDYDNFEFRSPINAWDVQEKHKEQYSKTKIMELTLTKNSVLHIPSYWCYSIQFGDNAVVLNTSYNTFMSSLSSLPQQFMYLMQQQNIKRKSVKCSSNMEIHSELKNKPNVKPEVVSEVVSEVKPEVVSEVVSEDKKEKKIKKSSMKQSSIISNVANTDIIADKNTNISVKIDNI